MGERNCQNCDQPAHTGVYCQRCADEIMARALNPPSGGCRKKVHRHAPATSSVQPRLAE